VDAKEEFQPSQTSADPRKGMMYITWDMGSLSKKKQWVTELLIRHSPHVMLLQEARILPHEFKGFIWQLRSLGYVAHHYSAHDLVTIWRRGLCIAPVALDGPSSDLSGYRVAFFALKLGGARFLLQHIHAPATGPKDRTTFFHQLREAPQSRLTLTAHDW